MDADRETFVKENAVALVDDRDRKIERMRKILTDLNKRQASYRSQRRKVIEHLHEIVVNLTPQGNVTEEVHAAFIAARKALGMLGL